MIILRKACLRKACFMWPAVRAWLPAGVRGLVLCSLLGGVLSGLGACGFALRQPVSLSFQTLAVRSASTDTPMVKTLLAGLARQEGLKLVPVSARPQVVLEVLTDTEEKLVRTLSVAGQVREVELRQRFRFTAQDAQGEFLIPPVELIRTRDMSYNERDALAKQVEQDEILEALRQDLLAQVMRRLSSLRISSSCPKNSTSC
jgi:LPS-assembly lipoprotein